MNILRLKEKKIKYFFALLKIKVTAVPPLNCWNLLKDFGDRLVVFNIKI